MKLKAEERKGEEKGKGGCKRKGGRERKGKEKGRGDRKWREGLRRRKEAKGKREYETYPYSFYDL
jgi:hypothetical protein